MCHTTADLMIGSVRECKAGEQSPEDEAWGGWGESVQAVWAGEELI